MEYKNLKNWDYKKISEISDTITDYVANGSFATLKANTEYCEGGDCILIRLVDYNNDFNDNPLYITEKSYEFLKKTKLYGGEIIISNVGVNAGTVFKAPLIDKKMSLGPNSIMIKTNQNDDFYFYWFKSPYGRHSLNSIMTGSAQPKFNKTDFRNVKVPVPSISEQKKIARILLLFDTKIELNNKIISNLESQAQAIFKNWFIDFEPFKDGEFLESELGLIPKGWEVKQLSELFSFNKGKKPKNLYEEINDGLVPYLVKGVIDSTELPKFTGDDKVIRIKDLDYFMLMDGANSGDIYFGYEGALGSTFSVIDVFEINNLEIIYFYLKLNEVLIKSQNTGSAIPHANKDFIYKMKLAIPNDINRLKVNSFLESVRKYIIVLKKQNTKLAEIRDTLLPKLMSGEIDVSKINIDEDLNYE